MLNSPCVATPDVGTAGLGRTPPRAARAAGRAPGACVVCGVYGGGPPCPDSVPPPGRCRTTALCRRRWQETAQEGYGKSPKDVGALWGGFSLGCYLLLAGFPRGWRVFPGLLPASCGFPPWVAGFPHGGRPLAGPIFVTSRVPFSMTKWSSRLVNGMGTYPGTHLNDAPLVLGVGGV